jgi:hypothetical protein
MKALPERVEMEGRDGGTELSKIASETPETKYINILIY